MKTTVRRAPFALSTVVVLSVTLVACAPVQPYRGLVSFLNGTVDREAAVASAAAALQQAGYTPSLINVQVGIVSTDWRTGGNWATAIFLGTGMRSRVNVTISDSALTLVGEYQEQSGPSILSPKQIAAGWHPATPPDQLKEEWNLIRRDLQIRLSELPASGSPVAPSDLSLKQDPRASSSLFSGPAADFPSVEPLPVDKRLRIAVIEFAGIGVEKDETHILVDRLRAELAGTGHFQVVERERMEEIFAEQGFQQSELCDTDECVVEVGRLVGVSGIVAGTIGKLGGTYTVTARMISVETGEIISRASDDCPCEVDGLLGSMQRLAVLLADRIELGIVVE